MVNLYSLLSGMFVGLLFAFFKLPIPAPPSITGILGIVGIYLGYVIITHFKG